MIGSSVILTDVLLHEARSLANETDRSLLACLQETTALGKQELKMRMGMAKVSGRALVDGELACEAEMMFGRDK